MNREEALESCYAQLRAVEKALDLVCTAQLDVGSYSYYKSLVKLKEDTEEVIRNVAHLIQKRT